MTPDPIILPVAHDPYAHRWNGLPFCWGGDTEALAFALHGGKVETAAVLGAHLSTVGGQNVTVLVVFDAQHDTLVAAARVDNSPTQIIAVEPVRGVQMGLGAATTFAEQSAARLIRRLLEPAAVQRIDTRPLPKLRAVLVREFGTDLDIVQSARVSYRGDKTKRLPDDDRKLLRYLMRHRHTSPFEQVALVFEVEADLSTVTQLATYRTAKRNTQSGRYTEMVDDYEITPPGGWRSQSSTNKQGSGAPLPVDVGERLTALEASATEAAWAAYRELLRAGVAREQARRVLPASTMTRLVWQCDLHNLLHVMAQRLAPDAQLEIRQLAAQMAVEVARRFPWTWAAWLELAAPAAIREMAAAQAVAS